MLMFVDAVHFAGVMQTFAGCHHRVHQLLALEFFESAAVQVLEKFTGGSDHLTLAHLLFVEELGELTSAALEVGAVQRLGGKRMLVADVADADDDSRVTGVIENEPEHDTVLHRFAEANLDTILVAQLLEQRNVGRCAAPGGGLFTDELELLAFAGNECREVSEVFLAELFPDVADHQLLLLTSLAQDGAHEVVLHDLPEHHEDVLVGAHVRCEHRRRRADQNQPIRRQVLKLAFASKVHADTRSEGALDDRLDHFGPGDHRDRDGEVAELIADRSADAALFATILGLLRQLLALSDRLRGACTVGASLLVAFVARCHDEAFCAMRFLRNR